MGGSVWQTRAEWFQRFRCCGCGWVDDCPGEEGVPVGLTGGSLLVELVASTGSTVTTTLVLRLFHIHKMMINFIHHGESAVLSLFCNVSHPRSSCILVTQPGVLVV